MPGPFIHNIDPIIADVGGIYLWWYGLSYSLGFPGVQRRHGLIQSRRRFSGASELPFSYCFSSASPLPATGPRTYRRDMRAATPVCTILRGTPELTNDDEETP